MCKVLRRFSGKLIEIPMCPTEGIRGMYGAAHLFTLSLSQKSSTVTENTHPGNPATLNGTHQESIKSSATVLCHLLCTIDVFL